MNITGIKLILTGVFFLSTFVCSTFPICLFSLFDRRRKSNLSSFSLNTLINCVTSFGGGIFLGACLLDLLPEVIHHINRTIKNEFNYDNENSKRYPIGEFLIGLGFFLILLVEQTILSCRSFSSKPAGQLTQIEDEDPLIQSTRIKQHQFNISERKDDLTTNQNRLIATRNLILILSLIIHSFFEGVALGSTNDEKAFFELFFAIIIHKSIIAFSLGLKLMKLSRQRLLYFSCFLFSLATPIGIFFVLTMEQFLSHSRNALLFHDVLRAFACGTFFYITFFDVLPHELNLSTHHRHLSSSSVVSNRSSLLKVFCIFVGFSSIALLSFVMK